jgi:hypothetical protein
MIRPVPFYTGKQPRAFFLGWLCRIGADQPIGLTEPSSETSRRKHLTSASAQLIQIAAEFIACRAV